MAIIAAVDNGTQSTKVLVYDSEERRILALESSPHQLVSRSDGTRVQMASWWTEAMQACFSRISPDLKSRIQAIGVSGQQHGFVPVSKTGEVLAPVRLWCDTSTQPECDIINARLGGRKAAIEAAGNEIKVGYTASKILAFKNQDPGAYGQMDKILLPHDYLNYFLTGTPTMECGDASGTGLLDIRTRKWSRAVLEAVDPGLDWEHVLPPLISNSQAAGTLSRKAAGLLGLKEGIPVSSGGGDNMTGAIGTGTVNPGSLVMSLGTSGTLYGCSDTPVVDPDGLLAAFCSSTDSYLPLLCTMNCTVSSELTRSLLNLDVKAFDALASQAPVGSQGVMMLPFFNGERSPNYPKGKGVIWGLDEPNFTRANLARAAMEASVFSLRYGLETFKTLGFQPSYITLVGGGAKSSLWPQMVSDITGLDVKLPVISEASAFGACLQALSLLEGTPIASVTRTHIRYDALRAFTPDSRNHTAYHQAYTNWSRLVSMVKPEFS